MIKGINSLPVKPEIKQMLISNIDLPNRVADLEKSLVFMSEQMKALPAEFVSKLREAAEKAEGNQLAPAAAGMQGGGGRGGQLIEATIASILQGVAGGGARNPFFEQIGREAFLDSFSFNKLLQREMAKKISKSFMGEWDKERKSLAKILEGETGAETS